MKEGDFEGALLSLDAAARALASQPARSRELGRAYLYLGAAYVGLGQESLARAKFVQALRADASLRPSADEFPLKVIRAFEAARARAAETAVLEKEARRKKGKGGLILLGAGGLAAAGVAVALTTKERANTPPTVAFTVAPDGQALVAATRMSFTATASDAEGDPLSYAWDFGDGATAGGVSVTHVYDREGSFNVVLKVGDGLASVTASRALTARTLTGVWLVGGQAFLGVDRYTMQQDRTPEVSVRVTTGGPCGVTRSSVGLVSDPRGFIFPYSTLGGLPCTCHFSLAGTVAPDLDTMSVSVSCRGGPACGCAGQQQALQLRRQ